MWKTKDERWLYTPNGEVPDTPLRKWMAYHLRRVRCENCETLGITEPTRDGPRYATDLPWEHRDSPNRTRYLCSTCKKEWEDYWEEMWEMARPSF